MFFVVVVFFFFVFFVGFFVSVRKSFRISISSGLCVILFLCSSVLLVLRLPRLGKRELILVLFVRCSVCACLDLSVSSSSWGLGRAAVCDCGTPWTFLLPFLPSLPKVLLLT